MALCALHCHSACKTCTLAGFELQGGTHNRSRKIIESRDTGAGDDYGISNHNRTHYHSATAMGEGTIVGKVLTQGQVT